MIQLVKLPVKRGNAPLRIAKGHFVTNHSHINYYVDITYQKTRLSEARDSAYQLVSSFVNITPTAEFNFWVDPEAAKIVVDSGCEIVIVPLDATHKAVMSLKDADELEASGKKAAIATASFIRHRQAGYKIWQPMADIDTVPIHDALAVCAVLNEDVLEDVRETYMDIDIAGGAADGMSICDLDKRYPDRKPNVKVALSANREIFSRMIKEIMC